MSAAELEAAARLDQIRWRHETHDDPETCWPECFELPEVIAALSAEEHRLYARDESVPRGWDDPQWCVCGEPWPCAYAPEPVA